MEEDKWTVAGNFEENRFRIETANVSPRREETRTYFITYVSLIGTRICAASSR